MRLSYSDFINVLGLSQVIIRLRIGYTTKVEVWDRNDSQGMAVAPYFEIELYTQPGIDATTTKSCRTY